MNAILQGLSCRLDELEQNFSEHTGDVDHVTIESDIQNIQDVLVDYESKFRKLETEVTELRRLIRGDEE